MRLTPVLLPVGLGSRARLDSLGGPDLPILPHVRPASEVDAPGAIGMTSSMLIPDPAVTRFLEFAGSPQGMDVIRAAGAVPGR
jgi:hypothetical protein